MVLFLHSGADICAHTFINSRYRSVIVHQRAHTASVKSKTAFMAGIFKLQKFSMSITSVAGLLAGARFLTLPFAGVFVLIHHVVKVLESLEVLKIKVIEIVTNLERSD